nr:PAS domain S-box protein [Arenimonas sp.]
MFPPMFDSLPDALLLVDDGGRIVSANQQAERLFGYPGSDLAGQSIELLLPEAMRDAHRALRAGYMRNPQLRPMGGSVSSLIGQGRDGQLFPVEISLSPIPGDDGVRILASVRDVSQTRRARQAVMRSRYDALVARIGQLALASGEERGVIEGMPAMLAETLGIEAVAIAFLRPEQDVIDFRASVGFGDGPGNMDVSQGEPWRALRGGKQF